MRCDGASSLSCRVSDLAEARDVSIGMLLLCTTDKMTIGAEFLGQFFAVPGIRFRYGAGDGEIGRQKRKDGEHPSDDVKLSICHASHP
jgi:hypothetical protein